MIEGELLPSKQKPDIAVVIPSYRVRNHILAVLSRIGSEVSAIYVVDDACPEDTGRFVKEHATDPRVNVLRNKQNLGVGGATLAGMKQAAADGADVIVKIDGDGQMDPALIPSFVGVILIGEADYAKGNRFFDPEGVASMPLSRLIGNAGLSFLAKISTGYWHSFDPTNGFFAIHASLIDLLPLEKISKRYFFESDLLFRLNVLTARVVDVPMHSHYADEVSNMKPHREIPRFAFAHLKNFGKRIFYNYFIRNFSIASLELVLGLALLLFGIIYGLSNWGMDTPATAGTVMVAALPIIVATQLVLAFINYDIQSVPRSTLHLRLRTSVQPMRALRHWESATKHHHIISAAGSKGRGQV
ncbi:glycosyltransferase family 2 protein [Mesorhizobium sp.]|uniref:glycosyltransferase family 2 protein n=1 Tax=Mesorhizobium sp. TaxID=1871066 RepID=UPI00120CEC43|nr:glycosyltransferase family 2 protein [Mesorhizobium sp.]TIS50595.1 MAG: glycosyltransferase family 2 protein [Mesorhizobium sp.]